MRVLTMLAISVLYALGVVAAPAGTGEARMAHTVPQDGVLFLSAVRDGHLIWDLSRVPDREQTNLEFPYLIRFKGHWYCSFREGNRHGNDPSGRARVIQSKDGETWETAMLLEWQGGDVRDPRMSVTPDGELMLNTSIYFIGKQKELPAEWEQPGQRQSVTWLSSDGKNWSGPYACPTGFRTWRWDVAWHDGHGYSVGYSGKDRTGTLYCTEDGKRWEVLVENFFPKGGGTEAALAFGADGAGYCLLRGGAFYGRFAVGRSPDYLQWEWRPLEIDAAQNGKPEPGSAFGKRTGSIVGGQKLLRLRDGRLVAATAKGGLDLFWVDPERALFTRFVRISDGKSYPGLAEYDGELWITNTQSAEPGLGVKSGIYLVRVKTPPATSLQNLLEVAEEKTRSTDVKGFGSLYRERLLSVRRRLSALPAEGDTEPAREPAARRELLRALSDYRDARQLSQSARGTLVSANTAISDSVLGFGQRSEEQVQAQLGPLEEALADASATIADVRGRIAALRSAAAGLANARAIRARAERSLAVVRTLTHEDMEGFARLYQGRLKSCARRLRDLLHDPDATPERAWQKIEDLLDATAELRSVARNEPVRVVNVTAVPGSVVWDDEAEWRRGALMDVEVENNALIPARKPLLSFGDRGRTSVRVANPTQIAELKNGFTMTAWGFPKSTERSYRTLIDKGGRDAAFSIRHGRTIANRNHVSARLYVEGEPHPHQPYGTGLRPADPADFDNRWHHYAATYDGVTLRLYIDGRRVGVCRKRGRADLSAGDLCIGCLASGNEPWRGFIEDVAVWAEALPATRISALSGRELRGDEEGLVGYWSLNEGQGDVARDLTPNENHGTIARGEWRELPVRSGYRLANPVRFAAGMDLGAASIRWDCEVEGDPDKAGVAILYGVTDNADALPGTWTPATNGAEINTPVASDALPGKCLWIKQILTTSDPAAVPRLRRMALSIR